MNGRPCQSPLGWDTLLAYWLGELEPDVEAGMEEHYLGCGQCSRRLERLAALARGIRTVARQSDVNMVISDQFVRRLSEEGMRVREYRVARNGSVDCTITPEDDFIVGRLEAPLAGVHRVDLVSLDSNGEIQERQEDVPFVARSGGVVVSPSINRIRALPDCVMHFRLLAVDAGGEITLGDYTFNHSAHPSPQ